MGAITRLDAVNQMLLASGESLVADLDEASGVDTGVAEFMLDRATEDFQMRGLTGNKYDKKMKPNSYGKLMLPSDLLSAELISNHTNDDGITIISSLRGEPDAYLWNVTDQTDIWKTGTEFTVEIIHEVRWEDMDTPVQRAVVSTAMRRYQLIMQGDGDMDAYLGNEELQHNARGRASDINDRRRTVFSSGSNIMQQALNRVSGVNNDPSRFRYWRGKRS